MKSLSIKHLLAIAAIACCSVNLFANNTKVIEPNVSVNAQKASIKSTKVECSGDIQIPDSITENSTKYPVTEITDGAFFKHNKITSVIIPGTVEFIGPKAFHACNRLKSVTCSNPIPPYCIEAFSNKANMTLYVPSKSINLYRNADEWKEFGSILPIKNSSKVAKKEGNKNKADKNKSKSKKDSKKKDSKKKSSKDNKKKKSSPKKKQSNSRD